MRGRIQRWGNSLALRIPKSFAIEAGLNRDTPEDVTLEKGKIVITPETTISLDELLAKVTDENIHGETSTGPAVGKEVW